MPHGRGAGGSLFVPFSLRTTFYILWRENRLIERRFLKKSNMLLNSEWWRTCREQTDALKIRGRPQGSPTAYDFHSKEIRLSKHCCPQLLVPKKSSTTKLQTYCTAMTLVHTMEEFLLETNASRRKLSRCSKRRRKKERKKEKETKLRYFYGKH